MKQTIQLLLLLLFASAGPADAWAQVRINEVGTNGVDFQGATKWVEFYNAGTAAVDVGSLILCDFPEYPEIRGLSIIEGDTNIPAGGFLVLSWPDLDANNSNDAEIGLYEAGTFDFNDATKMLDYIQWGAGNHTRASAAEEAGIWVASEFVPAPAVGQSLQYVDNSSTGAGNWMVGSPTPNSANTQATSIEEGSEVPDDFALLGNFPNPFNPSTTIVYELNQPGQITLSVFNVLGQNVVDLFDGSQPAGRYEFVWDGKDARGMAMNSGVYFYQLSFNGIARTSRVMTLLK